MLHGYYMKGRHKNAMISEYNTASAPLDIIICTYPILLGKRTTISLTTLKRQRLTSDTTSILHTTSNKTHTERNSEGELQPEYSQPRGNKKRRKYMVTYSIPVLN